jgi:hypothetical protein
VTDQTKTTGTLDQDGGDALEQSGTAGTPESEQSRDAESGSEPDYKALYLQSKDAVEERNRLKAELEELKGGSTPPPVAESPDVQAKTDQIEDVLSKAEAFRKQGDPVAAIALETRAELLATQRDLILERQLNRIPQDSQDAVVKHFNKNRHRLGDINAAYAEINAPRYQKENEELRKEIEVLKRGPDPEVQKAPPTHGREISARERKFKEMTEDEIQAEAARLERDKGYSARVDFLKGLNGPNPSIRLKR